jgi:protein O-mannosyl-transferase
VLLGRRLKVKRNNNHLYLAFLISLITIAVYFKVLQNDFIEWDDTYYITDNLYIRSLDTAFLRWAFLGFHAGNWHPLTWISHALDYALWGLNPLGHHLTNVLLHTINTGIVVLLAYTLFQTGENTTTTREIPGNVIEQMMLIAGGVTGLLFGLHPLHVESVAWVSERKDLLCGFFFLLSIVVYINYARFAETGYARQKLFAFFSSKKYLLAVCLFFLALLSKPMAVTLPLVLLLLDWYPLNRMQSSRMLALVLLEKLPFIALSLVSSVLTILAQKTGGAMELMDILPLSTRLLVAVKSLIAYLGKMVFPLNLIPFYSYPKHVSFLSPGYLSAIAFVIGITVMCMVLVKKQKFWLVAWGYYVITLIPVLGIVQVGGQSMADRYTYLPSIGPFLVVGLCTGWGSVKLIRLGKQGLWNGVLIGIIALLLIIMLSVLTIKQIGVWKNSITFWDYVIEKGREDVPLAYHNRGLTYYRAGRFDRAAEDFDKALELKPDDIDAYCSLGMVYLNIGIPDKAIESFDKAIALKPTYFMAYNNRGLVFMQTGRLDKALQDYEKAIALNPAADQVYYNLGVFYSRPGLFNKAIENYNKAISINPKYADAYSNGGLSYAIIGQYDKAMDYFDKAISLNQFSAVAYSNRAELYRKRGDTVHSLADFQQACSLGDATACREAKQLTQGRNPE